MAKSSAAPATPALSIELLRQTAEKLLTQAKSRRDTAALCERATESELKASKAMAEQMTGRKLDLVSTSVADSKRDARMNRNIAEKLEIEAAQLSAFVAAHQALYEALSAFMEAVRDAKSDMEAEKNAIKHAYGLGRAALALADAAHVESLGGNK